MNSYLFSACVWLTIARKFQKGLTYRCTIRYTDPILTVEPLLLFEYNSMLINWDKDAVGASAF